MGHLHKIMNYVKQSVQYIPKKGGNNQVIVPHNLLAT